MKMRKKLLAASLAVAMMFTGAISASAEDFQEPTEEIYTTMAMPAGELAGRVFFKENKTTLSFSAKKKIRRVIREIEGDYSLTIKGFAQFGETKTRDYLSKSRAMTVKRYLWTLGVDVDIQTVAGWAPAEKGVRDSARRAELFVNPLENTSFDLTIAPFHLDPASICPSGWTLSSDGEPVGGNLYSNRCSDNQGDEFTNLPSGSYKLEVGFAHLDTCDSARLFDVSILGQWVNMGCSPMGDGYYTVFALDFELDQDKTVTGPIWFIES
jgi:hypothetical protein